MLHQLQPAARSSSGAWGGGASSRWRSTTSGFRSIMASWSCRKPSAAAREMPAGSGVTLVKVVRFDICS